MSANRMTLPVSMSVMTYNQEQLVEQAVSSAMAQEYNGPLEILISDDCSTDDTLNILKDLISGYSGPHSIRLNVNDRNMGLIPHMHKVFAMPKYDFQVCMAGDDISKPDRVMRLAKIYEQTGALLIHSDVNYIDDNGKPLNGFDLPSTFMNEWTIHEAARSMALFNGATAAYHRDIIKLFGPMIEQDAFEDLVLGFRAALVDRVAYCDERLIDYRVGVGLSHADVKELRSQRQAHICCLATLRQRLIDAKGFGFSFDSPVLHTLHHAISHELNVLADIRD